ncbi:MAG: DUF1611 domain-containing protein [Pseudomonadota bacterium]
MIDMRSPYLIFLGDVSNTGLAKTAFGVVDWAREKCLGQLRFPDCKLSVGLPDMDVEAAARAGAKSLVIGVAPFGGRIDPAWMPTLERAIKAGLDIVSGLHDRLSAIPALSALAAEQGVALIDIRHPDTAFPIATGRKRTGKRLLMVGTDCSVGKKYTALAATQALKEAGMSATFRATGQTGIMISGSGIPIDAVVSDFIAGAAETLSPDAPADHWDVIEGQGSLFHPAYAGVTLGLLHGSQPDAMILCCDPTRATINGYSDFPTPSLSQAVDVYERHARLVNAFSSVVAISLNTKGLSLDGAQSALKLASSETSLPAFDPVRFPKDFESGLAVII